MEIVITDVTEMHGNSFCVAGWCWQQKRMFRLLPDGQNWTDATLQRHHIVPGTIISVNPATHLHISEYPHHTEDTIIDSHHIGIVRSGPFPWFGSNAPTVAPNINAGFDGLVEHNSIWNGTRQGAFIPLGAKTASLCALRLPRDSLDFIEDFEKLKVYLNDGTMTYKLPVSSKQLKEAWRVGGTQAARNTLPPTPYFHVRLGLARAFPNQPDKCYIILNGVHG